MTTELLIMCAILAGLAVAVVALIFQRSDLRRDLQWSREDAERWREEAVKRGWKNPFDECLDALNDGVAKLQAAAAVMRRASDIQRRNTAKLQEVNSAMQKTNAGLCRQKAALEKAAGQLGRSAAAARRSPDTRPEQDPAVQAVLDRLQDDLAAGRHPIDPKKLN